MKDYPQSPFCEEAGVWADVMQHNDRLNHTREKLNQMNDKLNQEKDTLNRMIEKSTQVDIEIENKKREKARERHVCGKDPTGR